MTQASKTVKTSNNKEYKVHTGLFINNEFVPGHGPSVDSINPATEEVIVSVDSADESDVNKAVQVAKDAYKNTWRKVAPSERARLLNKLADLIDRDQEEIADLVTLENGKAITFSQMEVGDAGKVIRYLAGWADKIHGKLIDTTFDALCYTRHEPLGVVGIITPWNYPIILTVMKFSPALAAGNTVVVKSSELTPLALYKIAELTKEAGFPDGVFNMITGEGGITGHILSHHRDIAKMTFTGSNLVGHKIVQSSADSNLKRMKLELGGKSAQIVCADADLQNAAFWAHLGCFSFQGQICFAGTRILIQEEVYDEFLKLLLAQIESKAIGDPFNPESFHGPIVNKKQFDKVLDYIKVGQEQGATLLRGGKRYGDKGYFIEPTVFVDCKSNMRIMQEEIFGPVVAIAKFKTIEEAIEIANDTKYGLAGAVYTSNLDTAITVSNELLAGTVWVNSYSVIDPSTPFGGYKESGFGRDLGEYAFEEYTQVKVVKIKRNI